MILKLCTDFDRTLGYTNLKFNSEHANLRHSVCTFPAGPWTRCQSKSNEILTRFNVALLDLRKGSRRKHAACLRTILCKELQTMARLWRTK